MNPSMIEIAERVLELDKLADPGPWNADEYHDILMGDGCVALENSSSNDWDAEFIAYTRTAASELAREVITLHEDIARYQERIPELIEQADAAYLPYRELVMQARADADRTGNRLYKALEALKRICKLADNRYDSPYSSLSNISAVAHALLKEDE